MENRAVFLANGGEKFAYVPCLNDSEPGMRVIEHVVRRELMGWCTVKLARQNSPPVVSKTRLRHDDGED